MKESKCITLICSLCLLLSFSAPALGQQKQARPEASMSDAEVKARTAAARREQLNQELFGAIDEQAPGRVFKLLAAGAAVNARDRDGLTPLMRAAAHGNSELTRLLLDKGAGVNLVNNFGVTALMQAAWAGHVQVVEMLIAAGGDANLQTIAEFPMLKKAGVTALMAASMNGNLEVARILLVDGYAHLNQQDAQGQTALMYAAHEGNPRLIGFLISKGVNMEIKDQFGRTALTIATIYGNYDAVCVLVTAGADVHTRDIHNIKPIVYASALDHGQIYKYLEAAMIRRPPSVGSPMFKPAP